MSAARVARACSMMRMAPSNLRGGCFIRAGFERTGHDPILDDLACDSILPRKARVQVVRLRDDPACRTAGEPGQFRGRRVPDDFHDRWSDSIGHARAGHLDRLLHAGTLNARAVGHRDLGVLSDLESEARVEAQTGPVSYTHLTLPT